jgi:hypothetical protein
MISSKEVVSGCWYSRGGIDITRPPLFVTLYIRFNDAVNIKTVVFETCAFPYGLLLELLRYVYPIGT